MEDATEWKILKFCCDKMDVIIKASVTYSKNDHFCSIVIDGLLIASTKGDDLFDTINATAKKAIKKIEDYSQQQKEGCSSSMPLKDATVDLDKEFRRIFPLFKTYIVNFKESVDKPTLSNPFKKENINAGALIPTNCNSWSWNAANYNPNYNPNYFLTKNYTTSTSNCLTVKLEPREIKVVKRKMLHPSFIDKHNYIDQSNIGFKMLLGLGWSGGPLGPEQNGIAEPISVELRTRRSGLGCADRQSMKSTYGNINSHNFFQYLKQYADDDRQYEDLEFSDDFSHKEKKKLYGISKDLNLQHVIEHRNGMLVVKIMKPVHNRFVAT